MPRIFTILASLFALTMAPLAFAAEVAASDPWLGSLNSLLAARYHTTGDLQISWNRTRPPTAPVEADLVIVSAPAELTSQLLVTVRAKSSSGQESEHTLVLHAELWRDGWMLREPAAIATPLNSAALETRRYDALRERDALASESLVELDFARSVPAGRLLARRDVVRRPLVRRGQVVDVVATDGNLTVTLRAIALDDAARGETVRVRNPDSKKDFAALVIAESRASVRF